MTLENIYLEKPIQIAGSKKWHVKFYAETTLPKAFLNSSYCKELITSPLEKWCENCLSDEYSINCHWNNADPCWNLFFATDQDLTTFMLRFSNQLKPAHH
jgi:hypothetical protein